MTIKRCVVIRPPEKIWTSELSRRICHPSKDILSIADLFRLTSDSRYFSDKSDDVYIRTECIL